MHVTRLWAYLLLNLFMSYASSRSKIHSSAIKLDLFHVKEALRTNQCRILFLILVSAHQPFSYLGRASFLCNLWHPSSSSYITLLLSFKLHVFNLFSINSRTWVLLDFQITNHVMSSLINNLEPREECTSPFILLHACNFVISSNRIHMLYISSKSILIWSPLLINQ